MSIKPVVKPWLLSGLLLGFSYPIIRDLPNGFLAWFAFVPFLLDNRSQKSLKKFLATSIGFILIFLLVSTWWVGYYNIWYMLIGHLAIAPFYLIPLIIFYIIHFYWGWHRALIILPFAWTLNDWFIHILPHGMQVHLTPYSQSNNIWFIQFADIFGMWGVSFWILLLNVLIALAIDSKKKVTYGAPILTLLLPLLYSVWCLEINPKGVTGPVESRSRVSIIQTNQNSYAEPNAENTQKLISEIFSLSDSAVRYDQPDLLVLPEATIPFELLKNKQNLELIKSTVESWQTSVAIGYVERPDTNDLRYFKNNALVFTPQLAMNWDALQIKPEDVIVYQKQYGVPFAEVMPYFEDKPTFRNMAMIRGSEPVNFKYSNFERDHFQVALSICWEQFFPEKISSLVNEGAQFVAFMNNDAWFGTTSGSIQLQSATRLRAIENRRTIVRSSNGGISCFIDPFGKVYGEVPWFISTIATEEVLCIQKKSFYTEHPEWFLWATLIGFLSLLVFLSCLKRQKLSS